MVDSHVAVRATVPSPYWLIHDFGGYQAIPGLKLQYQGLFRPVPREVDYLGIFLLSLLPWACSSRCHWLKPANSEVTNSHVVRHRSLFQACSLTRGSIIPAPGPANFYDLVLFPSWPLPCS